VLECVHGEHTQLNSQHPAENRPLKAAAKLAKTSGRSSNFLIADAVESYVADQEKMLAELPRPTARLNPGITSGMRT